MATYIDTYIEPEPIWDSEPDDFLPQCWSWHDGYHGVSNGADHTEWLYVCTGYDAWQGVSQLERIPLSWHWT